jgi:hypothetical protein
MLVFPTRDASLNACGAAMLDRAGPARVGPVAAQPQSLFLVGVVVLEPLSRWADVDIFIGQITKVSFDKVAFGFAEALCLRLSQPGSIEPVA